MKRKQIYIAVLTLSLGIYFIVEWTRPEPVNWMESYSGIDKIPYGCFIMRDLLSDAFPGQEISYQSEPIFSRNGSDSFKNALFINNEFAPDTFEAEKLLQQVQEGKNIFIAAKTFQGELSDTLGIEISNSLPIEATDLINPDDSVRFRFTNKEMETATAGSWFYPERLASNHFDAYDTLNTTILGKDSIGNVQFIKVNRGEGAFFIHTVPQVFTNFYMRNQNHAQYAFRVLSHMPVAPTVWDEYYKAGRGASGSPFRFVASHRYLSWAWKVTLAGIFCFIIFRAKRRERIIPEINPPKNSTLEFAKTIGQLYYQSGNRSDLARKKVTYFMDFIREKLNLKTDTIDHKFIHQVSSRAGVDQEVVEKLFKNIETVNVKSSLTSRELWELNNLMETFYKQSSR